jgi:hypothetical protein
MTPDSRANSQRLSQSALRPRSEPPWGIPHRVAKLQEPSLSPDGRLWFANGVVLQMIDPGHLTGNGLPPPAHVEEVIADRKNYSPRQDLRLPPLTRDLEIDDTALSFVVPQKVRFRYKLEGRDAAGKSQEHGDKLATVTFIQGDVVVRGATSSSDPNAGFVGPPTPDKHLTVQSLRR